MWAKYPEDAWRKRTRHSPEQFRLFSSICGTKLGVMCIGFMLAVIWRSLWKTWIIKQFLKGVYWGELDYLVVDAPPRTSDEHISIVQFLQETGILPPCIPARGVSDQCAQGGQVLQESWDTSAGVVENMNGLWQPLADVLFMRVAETGEDTEWALECIRQNAPDLLDLVDCTKAFDSSRDGAARMCAAMAVQFLVKVPMDSQLGKASEEGRSCMPYRSEMWNQFTCT